MEISQLGDGMYEIPIEHVRSFVLTDSPSGAVTVVDTGFEHTADEFVATLESAFDEVDRLILTHDGPDHYGGVEAMMRRFEPTLCAPADEQGLLDALDRDPDITFTDGDVLDGGIEVIQVPGHTPSPSALLVRNKGALISGDVLDGADRRGLPAGYLLPPPELYNHDHAAAERNLSTLLEYDFEAVFVFHGSHVTNEPKAKIDHYLNFREHYR